MPYIKQDQRKLIQDDLTRLVGTIRSSFTEDEMHGVCNYVISVLVCNLLEPFDGWRYHSLQKAYGLFGCAASEFYRRLIAPYEDKAIENNGDLTLYRTFVEEIKHGATETS